MPACTGRVPPMPHPTAKAAAPTQVRNLLFIRFSLVFYLSNDACELAVSNHTPSSTLVGAYVCLCQYCRCGQARAGGRELELLPPARVGPRPPASGGYESVGGRDSRSVVGAEELTVGEMGFQSLDHRRVHLLLGVVVKLFERSSTITSSNKGVRN